MNNFRKIVQSQLKNILVTALLILILVYCIFTFIGLLVQPTEIVACWLSLVVSILCIYLFKINEKINVFGLTSVLFLYIICTNFGLSAVYYLLGEEYLSSFSKYTIAFLFSDQFVSAVILSIIATIVYAVFAVFGSLSGEKTKNQINDIQYNINSKESNRIVNIGYIFLLVTFFYFLFLISNGNLNLTMSYSAYRESIINNNPLYVYILIFYSVGITYVISAGNYKQIRIGIFMFVCTAFILLATGNKGEVLYPVLACIGISQYRGYKIKAKLIIFIMFIMFIFIPFITSTRKYGVLNSFNEIGINFTGAFTEIGLQLRLTVNILEEFSSGMRSYLYGFSYYNPIVNILDLFIPFYSIRLEIPLLANFRLIYPNQGFNQVAESYANFGLMGIILFFGLLGFLMAKVESRKLRPLQVAYFSSVVAVFINATRNSFSFVPAHLIILSVIYFLAKLSLRHN
ncbi:O-antigen polysaccharide polymerase Wzy [Clostridium intestinale]|uniref:O-antigen polysaccharide polymerase Wzy n=1 Tax=Clostridium intestinale TaxID=36845 RepID=UPI0028F094AF|nr:O-antigen polysaccharide polymerase Wzy [Clostridium intestinale]